MLDAHRQELFTAVFRRDAAGGWVRNGESRLITVEAWLAALRPGDAVIGPVLSRIAARLPDSIIAASPEAREPHAGTVAELAAEAYAAGRRDDVWQIVPWYGRLAAAEEKRLGITS